MRGSILPRVPISRRQVELVVSRSTAAFGVIFAFQALPGVVGASSHQDPLWNGVVASGLFLSLVASVVATVLNRGVRAALGVVAIFYLVALVTLPLAVSNVDAVPPGQPWVYLLLNVATGAAAVAFSLPWASAYLAAAPVVYAIVRISPAGGQSPGVQAMLEAFYTVIVGATILVIVTTLRQASSQVDSVQATALDRYSIAVRQHATNSERVRVDSIVHDSVLTTLLAAGRSTNKQSRELAAKMAAGAIRQLTEAALVTPADNNSVRIAELAERIALSATTLDEPWEIRMREIGSATIPSIAAEAVYSAALQAMVNSIQHAGNAASVTRWVAIRRLAPVGIEVDIGDTGSGFFLGDVPFERLGVRVSIIERVANAGGQTEIDSAIDEGTVVSIRWPRMVATEDEALALRAEVLWGSGGGAAV
ncbi:MAG: sensor histidine kinase [Microbacteriaceae bacterium]